MTETVAPRGSDTAASRVIGLYLASVLLGLVVIGLLVGYVIRLGPLTGPGVESSFGLALAGLLLTGALLFHIADRVYRVWPLGRRFAPSDPGHVREEGYALALRVIVVVAAAGAIAYVLGGLIAS